jgi:hypothetical protein
MRTIDAGHGNEGDLTDELMDAGSGNGRERKARNQELLRYFTLERERCVVGENDIDRDSLPA